MTNIVATAPGEVHGQQMISQPHHGDDMSQIQTGESIDYIKIRVQLISLYHYLYIMLILTLIVIQSLFDGE